MELDRGKYELLPSHLKSKFISRSLSKVNQKKSKFCSYEFPRALGELTTFKVHWWVFVIRIAFQSSINSFKIWSDTKTPLCFSPNSNSHYRWSFSDIIWKFMIPSKAFRIDSKTGLVLIIMSNLDRWSWHVPSIRK